MERKKKCMTAIPVGNGFFFFFFFRFIGMMNLHHRSSQALIGEKYGAAQKEKKITDYNCRSP
jgi:hypothetical protein